MSHKFDVSVVGDINMDIVPETIPEDADIKEDGQLFLDDAVYRRGGQGANFAVKASELGSKTVFHGKVGEDRHAEFLEDHLVEKGVEPRLSKDPSISTGTTVVVPWESGERFYLSHAENNAKLSIEDIELRSIKKSKHLARRGVWFSEPMLKDGNKKLLRKAKQAGIETSIDLHWDPKWGRDEEAADKRRKHFLEALKHTDFLMGNEEELKKLVKAETLEVSEKKIREIADTVLVIHRGSEGSRIVNGSERIDIPTENVENPANPTGTGDVFDASFLYHWQNGEDLEGAGRKATEEAVKHLKGLS